MKDTKDHIEIVVRARQGDQEAIGQLTEIASQRLSQFVFRLTLQEELTQDIVQESLVDMLKFFPTLKHTERFWYWLYGISYHKIGRHFQRQKVRRSVSLSQVDPETMSSCNDQTVADVISQEIREIVGRSMQQIDPNHRAILTMRCYDQMSYSEIAQLMNCSEFSARSLFYRAKKSLTHHLAGHGLEKGAMLTALVVFGKMTATSKAAAANMTISTASLQVGAPVALFCTLVSRTAVLWSLGALLGAGAWAGAVQISADNHSPLTPFHPDQRLAETLPLDPQRWSYYPQGTSGPVLIRTQARPSGQNHQWHILQNAQGNFVWENQTITFRNAHARLGAAALPQSANHSRRSVLLLEELNTDNLYDIQATHHQNVLQEDYFQPDWPSDIRLIDERDPMHQQGWARIGMTGFLNGSPIQGVTCIPFTYDALSQHKPWLKCTVGHDLEIVDTPKGASLRQSNPSRLFSLPAGSFLLGLNRPWLGLHCADDLARAAHEQHLGHRTEFLNDAEANLIIECGALALHYDIDLDNDLIRGIRWIHDTKTVGEIHFEFNSEPETPWDKTPMPAITRKPSGSSPQLGLRWLAYLGEGQLTDQFE